MGQLLSLLDRDWIEERLRQLTAPLCEYSFANLYLFRHVHGYELWREPLPGISGMTYDGVRHFMPLVALAGVPQTLLRAVMADGSVLYPIDVDALSELNPSDAFEVSYNEDDSDYVYETQALQHYRGAVLGKKLNQVRQFEREYGPSFEALTAANGDAARSVLERWFAESGKALESTDFAAASEALQLREALSLTGYLARTAAGEAVGFLLGSPAGATSWVVRFAKGLRSCTGVFPYLFNRLAHALPSHITHLNFEQDLGNPRFRQNKRSYAPVALRRKYRVRLK